ncbi:unnamed protein product, partial [Amoebophrya sp. A120]
LTEDLLFEESVSADGQQQVAQHNLEFRKLFARIRPTSETELKSDKKKAPGR